MIQDRLRRTFLALAICVFAGPASAQSMEAPTPCGTLANAYGPWDYRRDKERLPIVIENHFTPEVEMLLRGKSGPIGGDLDYTLRAIPNHPRALLAMMRYGEKMRTDQPQGSRYSVECWFDRALRFRPDDKVVRMLYVTFLTKATRNEDAMRQLSVVASNAEPDNPFTQYNLGLLYFELKAYDRALEHAHKAEAMGYPIAELRDKLRSASKWSDAAPAPAAGASEAAAAAQSPASAPR